MKFFVPISAILIVTFPLLSSCVPYTPRPPEGVWQSEEPRLVMYFLPEYRNIPRQHGNFSYLGVLALDDDEIGVVITFGNGSWVGFIDTRDYLEDGRLKPESRGLGGGDLRILENQIRFSPNAFFRERVGGYRHIFFNQIEDYDPIDPSEWFPYLPYLFP